MGHSRWSVWRVRARLISAAACLALCPVLYAAAIKATVSPTPSWARWQTTDFEHLGVERGLPHATVTAFAQDADGLMWIGTIGGLARYDGQRTQTFRQSKQAGHGPPDDYIRALQATADGSILIGTTSGGLARFDPQTNRFTAYDRTAARGTGSRIYALAADRSGGYWVAGQDGLSYLHADLRRIERWPELANPGGRPGAQVFSVLQDSQAQVWAGSNAGLYVRRAGAIGFERFISQDASAALALSRDIWALMQDRAGNLWVGSGANGVVMLDAQGRAHAPAALRGDSSAIQHRTVRAIVELPDGQLWIATDGVGVVVWDPRTQTAAPIRHDNARTTSLSGDIARALFVDRSSGVWVATESAASRHDTRPVNVISLAGSVLLGDDAEAGENVRSIHTDRAGTVWAGFSRGRIVAIDPARGTIRALTLAGTQSDQDVRALDELDDGRIIAGSRGLVTIDPDTLRVDPFPLEPVNRKPILALSAQPNGLWIGTYDGLYHVADNGQLLTYQHRQGDPHSLVDNHVRNIVPFSNGETWIATANGISILDAKAQRFDNLQNVPGNDNSLPQNYVGSIVPVATRVWVGTYGGLVSTTTTADDPAHPFTLARDEDSSSDDVASVLVDHYGRLWTSSTSGLAVYDPHLRRTLTLGVRDGLRTRRFNQRTAATGPSGELLFGGPGGLTVVVPTANATPSAAPAALTVTAMTVNEREVPYAHLPRPGHPLDTGSSIRSMRLGFALLDYTAPTEVRYAYRLEGFDEPWVTIDPGARPETKYTNLPGGRYHLLLRARIPGLHPQTVETRIPMIIGPRWHERTAVRVALFALLLGAIYGLVHVRTYYLRRHTTQLARQVRDQTTELQAANRRLEHLANTDGLTSLLTRRALMAQLKHEHASMQVQQRPLSILMLDLDTFKDLNDHFGHLAGDEVLRKVADIARACSAPTDHVGRYGGEEILLILPGVSGSDAAAMAEQIRQTIADCALPFEGNVLHFTASIGVATLQRGELAQTLIARTDAAMYCAKRAGRNTVKVA